MPSILQTSILYNNLNNSSPPSQSYLNNFIFNNFKIIHSCKFSSSNLLLILEALLIKLNKPGMNSGLKASKELSLFVWSGILIMGDFHINFRAFYTVANF